MSRYLSLLFILALPACTTSEPADQGGAKPPPARSVTVRRVLSGDTLELEGGEIVRLAGIRAPGNGEPFCEEARLALETYVIGRDINSQMRFFPDLADGRGRRVGHLEVPAKALKVQLLVNTELLERGLARIDYKTLAPMFEPFFESKEERARTDRRGLWAIAR